VATHRTYQVRNIDDGASVSIQGDLGGYLARWSTMFPRYVNRVIRHAAYKTQWLLKHELLAHAPGGEELAPLSWIQRVRAFDYYRKYGRPGSLKASGLAFGMNGGEWPLGGKLTQAIGYQTFDMDNPAKGSALVGWLSWSAAALGVIFQKETRATVTPETRRMYAAAGVPLSPSRAVIIKPARPVIEPFRRNRRRWIMDVIEKRFFYYMELDAARTAAQCARREM